MNELCCKNVFVTVSWRSFSKPFLGIQEVQHNNALRRSVSRATCENLIVACHRLVNLVVRQTTNPWLRTQLESYLSMFRIEVSR